MNQEPEPVDQRVASAWHEAGHAVMALYLGGWIDAGGVEIDERQNCSCTFVAGLDALASERVTVLSCLAGWRSEHLWHEGEILDAHLGDDARALSAMRETRPEATEDELMQRYADYAKQCDTILRKPEVWDAVERIAEKLIECGRLSMADVVEAIGDDAALIRPKGPFGIVLPYRSEG